jgi:negative regulator of sigma E activity
VNEHFNKKISEFIDDEMSAEEGEFFVRRLQSDESARRRYLRYQLIGAAVRGEYRYPGATELGPRLEQALGDDVPDAHRPAWVNLASGTGIAASIVLVAVFGLSTVMSGAGSADRNGIESSSQPFMGVPTQDTGIQYLMHHADYTSGLNRTIMRSSVIAGREADPTGESGDASLE